MLLHPKQKEIVRSGARFKVIRAGRRFGKTLVETEIMLYKAVVSAVGTAMEGKDRNVIYIAPTQKQARSIVWSAFRARLHKIGDFNESRLEITLPTQDGGTSKIFIGGWENRENYRGMPNVHHITFDEVDTMKDFFMGWQEIFRPMLIDTNGTADFIGTPKKENPNLRRLEKFADENSNEYDPDFERFHYTTSDNPHIPNVEKEIEKARKELDIDTFRQEIMAEYVDNAGALFHYDALVDVFSNTVVLDTKKYLIVDVADDGSDKTIFSFWEGLEEYKRVRYERLNTEGIIGEIKEAVRIERIPHSHVAVDAIGVGAGVASSSMLDGIIGFKSSFSPIKTDKNIVALPNVGYTKVMPLTTDFKNLRSQCIFTLADYVNNHRIASRVDGRDKEIIIEELSNYQDASSGDGKRMATPKEDVKMAIGRSPDDSDTWIMRMYFELIDKIQPQKSEEMAKVIEIQGLKFDRNMRNKTRNSTK